MQDEEHQRRECTSQQRGTGQTHRARKGRALVLRVSRISRNLRQATPASSQSPTERQKTPQALKTPAAFALGRIATVRVWSQSTNRNRPGTTANIAWLSGKDGADCVHLAADSSAPEPGSIQGRCRSIRAVWLNRFWRYCKTPRGISATNLCPGGCQSRLLRPYPIAAFSKRRKTRSSMGRRDSRCGWHRP